MVEGAASLMSVFYGRNAAGLWSEKRGANILDGGAPYYCVYETLDGRYVSIAAIEGKFFAELAERIGLPESFVSGQNDRSLWPEMKRRLEAIFRTKTRDEWCASLEGTDACFAPVLTVSEAPRHKHNVSRDVFVEVGGYLQPAPAPRFSRSITAKPGAVPGIGAQTDEVLAEIGCSAKDITALRTVGAIK
jgi:alpha-methylacyl-CoA racemase